MNESYINFLCAHYGLYGNAPVPVPARELSGPAAALKRRLFVSERAPPTAVRTCRKESSKLNYSERHQLAKNLAQSVGQVPRVINKYRLAVRGNRGGQQLARR